MTLLHVLCYCGTGQTCSELQSSAVGSHTRTITLQLQQLGADIQASTLIPRCNNCTGPQTIGNVSGCQGMEDTSDADKQQHLMLGSGALDPKQIRLVTNAALQKLVVVALSCTITDQTWVVLSVLLLLLFVKQDSKTGCWVPIHSNDDNTGVIISKVTVLKDHCSAKVGCQC